MSGEVVKFPIGVVVRQHRIRPAIGATTEEQAIDEAMMSVRHAIKSLKRQEASLHLRSYRAREKATPEQRRRMGEEIMRRVEERIAENAENAAAAAESEGGDNAA